MSDIAYISGLHGALDDDSTVRVHGQTAKVPPAGNGRSDADRVDEALAELGYAVATGYTAIDVDCEYYAIRVRKLEQ